MATTGGINRRVEEIFTEVSELPPDARGAAIDRLCADDASLRAEVQSLLGFHERATGMLDARPFPGAGALLSPVAGTMVADEAALPAGARIGRYTIRGVLGSGGMGIVYVAEQERPRRTVALKLIRGGAGVASLLRRFEHEAELLGRLHHPGIAQIFEAGAAPSDRGTQPFIAMELVAGRSLTDFARERSLSTGARLALVARVCDAVEHAHQRGVIHRDLKPGNILVDESGPEPQPKILDFGVARAVGRDVAMTTVRTGAGQLVGTLQYMSPEQVEGDPAEVDTRADVYALGVILYEVLTGRLPHDLTSRSIPEAARVIRDEPPRRLSLVSRAFRGDVETIVVKALEKDRRRRYQSASALADDIRRFLEGRPILAKQDSALYVLSKQFRRHRALVSACAAVLVGIVVFGIVATIQAQKERTARAAADLALGDARAAQRRADADRERLRRGLYMSDIGFAQAAYLGGDVDRMRARLRACPEDLRGWEWRYLMRRSDESTLTLPTPGLAPAVTAIDADGARATIAREDGRTGIVDLCSGEIVGLITDPPLIYSGAFDPLGDGVYAAAASGPIVHVDGSGRIDREVIAGKVDALLQDVSRDGTRLLTLDRQRTRAVLRSAMDGTPLRRFVVADALLAVLSPDAAHIGVGFQDGRVGVIDAESGVQRDCPIPHSLAVRALRFSPDGRWLASGGNDGELRIWDLGSTVIPARPHRNKLLTLAWSPDGRWIVSSGTDLAVSVTEAATGRFERSLFGHSRTVARVGFSSDAGEIVSIGADSTIRRWSGWDRPFEPTASAASGVMCGVITSDSRTFFGGGAGVYAGLDARTLVPGGGPASRAGTVSGMAISPDDSQIGVASHDGNIYVKDRITGADLRRLAAGGGRALDVAFDPAGTRVAGVCDAGILRVWNLADGSVTAEIKVDTGPLTGVVWLPDGNLAVGEFTGPVRIVSAGSGDTLGVFEGHTRYTWQLACNRAGTLLASAGEDGQIIIWRTARPGSGRVLLGHQGPVHTVAFSPDGLRLVSGGWDNTVRVWDVASGQELVTLRGHIGAVHFAMFTPDGERIVSGCNFGAVKVWDAGPGAPAKAQ